VPLQLQLLEPDHLDTNRTTGQGGNRVVMGVEFNSFGRRVAYWLFPDHPGSSHPTTTRTVSVRVPASEILHVFRRTRPGQTDAAPWLSPAIIRTRSLDEFEDAELLRQTIASSWAGFVTREEDPDGPTGDEDFAIDEIEPGSLEYLRPGESIEFPQLPQVSGRADYVAIQLRAIASCLRVPYEAFTGDLTRVNYSSGRMGFNAFERRIAKWRRTLLVDQFLDPILAWFIEAALSKVLLGAAARSLVWSWTPPGSLILDADKEGKADYAAIRNGTKSLSEVIRSRGKDPARHLEEVAQDFAALDELGLTLDCDPRRVAAAGSGAPPPEADEEDVEDELEDEPDEEREEGADPEPDEDEPGAAA
jgi:lambda family phage portal protein